MSSVFETSLEGQRDRIPDLNSLKDDKNSLKYYSQFNQTISSIENVEPQLKLIDSQNEGRSTSKYHTKLGQNPTEIIVDNMKDEQITHHSVGQSNCDNSVGGMTDEDRRPRSVSIELLKKRFLLGHTKFWVPSSIRTTTNNSLFRNPDGLERIIRTPRFPDAYCLNEKLRTFVVIQVFEGHQIINNWKCGDLVHYVNTIAHKYYTHVPSNKKDMILKNILETVRLQSQLKEKNFPIQDQKISDFKSNIELSTLHPFETNKDSHKINTSIPSHTLKESLQHVTTPDTTVSSSNIFHHHYYYYIPADQSYPCSSIPDTTHHTQRSGRKRELKQTSQLTYRDLRQVFTDGSPVPSIEVRRHCIIICLPPLSCVVMADRVFLLVVEDMEMDELISNLQGLQLKHMGLFREIEKRLEDKKKVKSITSPTSTVLSPPRQSETLLKNNVYNPLSNISSDINYQSILPTQDIFNSSNNTVMVTPNSTDTTHLEFPIEFEGIELLVSAALSQLDSDIAYLEKQLDTVINKPANRSPTSKGGEELHVLKCHTRLYQDRVALYDKTFETLMANPEELVEMELTRLKETEQMTAVINAIKELDSTQRKALLGTTKESDFFFLADTITNQFPQNSRPDPDLEILLEFFDQEIELLRQRLRRLNEKIESTERLASFNLALSHNRLLRWDVGSGMIAVAMGIGTLVTGIFGMNLQNDHETDQVAFRITAIVIGASTIVFFIVICITLRMTRL